MMGIIKNTYQYLKRNYPYITVKKILNLLRLRYEFKMRRIKLKSRPCIYYIDTGNICNLRCPLCPTGMHKQKRKPCFMSFKDFKNVLDKIKDYAIDVGLYNWGEPFLNKDIFKMIRYAKKNRVGTFLSTNLNVVDEKIARNIVKSGLDMMIISLDGVDQKTYGSYRIGGDFKKVISNIRLIKRIKKEYGTSRPHMVWQYLVNKKNEKHVLRAKKMAKKLGIEINFAKFMIDQEYVKKKGKADNSVVEEWIPENLRNDISNYTLSLDSPCFFLYHNMIINPDCKVSACCAVNDEKTDFGDMLSSDLDEIWNNVKYLSARSIFSDEYFDGKVTTLCHSCDSIKR